MTVVFLLFHPRLVGLLGLIGTKADPAPRRTGDLCSLCGGGGGCGSWLRIVLLALFADCGDVCPFFSLLSDVSFYDFMFPSLPHTLLGSCSRSLATL